MQRGAKQKECRGNIDDERKPGVAQHRNVAAHSHSLAITATHYLAESLICISNTRRGHRICCYQNNGTMKSFLFCVTKNNNNKRRLV